MAAAWNSLQTTFQVVVALVRRDARSRFQGSSLGLIISVLRPVAHLTLLLTIWHFANRPSPLGADATVFFATGVAPYVLCSWPARQTAISMLSSRPLLVYPRVKIMDLVFATAIVEIIVSCVSAVIMVLGLLMIGVDFDPADPALFLAGLLSALYFGVSMGIMSAIITAVAQFWIMALSLFLISMAITSGTFFFPDYLPLTIQKFFAWLPLLQAIELTRVGYYGNITSSLLMPYYTVSVSSGLIIIAFVLERLLRSKILRP
jgi:capsular polysaccharide transport system permease protein